MELLLSLTVSAWLPLPPAEATPSRDPPWLPSCRPAVQSSFFPSNAFGVADPQTSGSALWRLTSCTCPLRALSSASTSNLPLRFPSEGSLSEARRRHYPPPSRRHVSGRCHWHRCVPQSGTRLGLGVLADAAGLNAPSPAGPS